jgi:hypothetical protein
VSTDPYAPPQASLGRASVEPAMPRSIRLRLLVGVIAAAIEVALALRNAKFYFDFISLNPQLVRIQQVNAAFSLAHACILTGLGYGIYRGSRTCALLALATLLLLEGTGLVIEFTDQFAYMHASDLVAPLLFCGSYAFATATAFSWQRWRTAQRSVTAA